jgi:hypothetical protein
MTTPAVDLRQTAIAMLDLLIILKNQTQNFMLTDAERELAYEKYFLHRQRILELMGANE